MRYVLFMEYIMSVSTVYRRIIKFSSGQEDPGLQLTILTLIR